MSKYPIPFNHPCEAMILKGVGPKITKRLEERLRQYCADTGQAVPIRSGMYRIHRVLYMIHSMILINQFPLYHPIIRHLETCCSSPTPASTKLAIPTTSTPFYHTSETNIRSSISIGSLCYYPYAFHGIR